MNAQNKITAVAVVFQLAFAQIVQITVGLKEQMNEQEKAYNRRCNWLDRKILIISKFFS